MSNQLILNRIKKEFDYLVYCEEHHGIKRTAREDELRICCFVCGDNDYKLYINTKKNKFNCFKCEFSSGSFDVFDFVALTENIPRGKAILKTVQNFMPITPDEIAFDEEVVVKPVVKIKTLETMPVGAKLLTSSEVAEEVRFWEYLRGRGLTDQEIRMSKLHYVNNPEAWIFNENKKCVGNLYDRVVFPVYGPEGKLVSWMARSINSDGKHKYLNCPESDLHKTLWPYIEPMTSMGIIVEGILDNISVRRLDSSYNVYSTFGKHISKEQIKILKNWEITHLIVFWDIKDAKKEIMRAVENLKVHFDVFVPDFSEWPVEEDSGDLLKREDGVEVLKKALLTPVSTSSLEYIKWQIIH